MPRPAATDPNPHLVKKPARRNWYVSWTPPGTRRSRIKSTGINLEDPDLAEQWLTDFRAALEDTGDRATVAQLIDNYLNAKTGARTANRMVAFGANIQKYMGLRTPEQITAPLIAKYLDHRKGQVTAVRNELTVLIAALNHAGVTPGAKIIKPPPFPPREHFASREQVEALLAAASDHLRLYVLVAACSGARKSAILDLTWDRVDEDRAILDFNNPDIPISKKRRPVTPIPAHVVAALRVAREDAVADTVIEYGGKPVGDVRKAFRRTAERAGLPEWLTPHVLKHSVISWLAEDGWNVDRISDLTQTTPETVSRIYRKVNPESLRGMADSLNIGKFARTPCAQTQKAKTT